MSPNGEFLEIQERVSELLGNQEFKPFAVYHDRLDCIRVLIRDCSTIETRVNKYITLLEASHTSETGSRFVGFTIKGALYLCKKHGIARKGLVILTELLDAVVRELGQDTVDFVVSNLVIPILEEGQVESVNLPRAA